MSELDVKFFPTKEVKNNYLGGGFLRTGLVSVKFSVWKNDKFDQGFAVRLPSSKDNRTNEFVDEVSFANREASDVVYAKLAPLVSALLGRDGGAGASYSTSGPSNVTRQQPPAAGTGSPDTVPW